MKQVSALQYQSEAANAQAKLPKLVITKFNGTFTDWNSFGISLPNQSINPICQQLPNFHI